MPQPGTCPAAVEDLIVHLGRLSSAEDAGSGLTAAQWTCLRFLARANGATRTPSAFARFQATSRGTATQTIKSLETRGLVRRCKVPGDGRSVRLDLTPEGRAALAADPLGPLACLLGDMQPAERDALGAALLRIGCALAAARGSAAFGYCDACSHCETAGETRHCRDRGEVVPASEIDLLCDRFSADPAKLR